MLWHLKQKINFYRMKKVFFYSLILFCNIVFSQTSLSETHSKIKFVYEQKSNFFIENDQLYADTLVLKMEFPKLKFSKTASPLDSTKVIGSVNIKSLNYEDNNKLGNILYHSTHTIDGAYDAIKHKTTLFFTRGNAALNVILKKYFKGTYQPFSFNVVIDYNKKQIYTNYPNVNYEESFDSQLKKINFLNDEKTLGTYTFENKLGFQTNEITLNKKYSNKIIPHILFSNNDFAVNKITSLLDTITLLSVTYE
jgi:hypothetical protein